MRQVIKRNPTNWSLKSSHDLFALFEGIRSLLLLFDERRLGKSTECEPRQLSTPNSLDASPFQNELSRSNKFTQAVLRNCSLEELLFAVANEALRRTRSLYIQNGWVTHGKKAVSRPVSSSISFLFSFGHTPLAPSRSCQIRKSIFAFLQAEGRPVVGNSTAKDNAGCSAGVLPRG
jgi:hypothetical protein